MVPVVLHLETTIGDKGDMLTLKNAEEEDVTKPVDDYGIKLTIAQDDDLHFYCNPKINYMPSIPENE